VYCSFRQNRAGDRINTYTEPNKSFITTIVQRLPIALTVCTFFFTTQLFAEQNSQRGGSAWGIVSPVIDSLQLALNTASDTVRVRVLNGLCWEYRNKDALRSFDYSNQAFKLAKELGFMSGLAENRNFTGVVHRNIGDYPKAMTCFTEAREYAERGGLKTELAFSLTNIGEVYRYQKNYTQALHYVYRGLEMFLQIQNKQGQYFAYIRLGEIYLNQRLSDSALSAFKRSLTICEETHDGYRAAGSLRRIGAVYRSIGNFEDAMKSFQAALRFANDAKDNDESSATLIDLGSLNASVGRYKEALVYTQQGLQRAEKTSVKLRFAEAYKTLSGIYIALKQFKEAATYQELYINIRDSLFSESGKREIERMSVKYELQQQQQKIEMLNKEREAEEKIRNELIVIVIISAIFTLALLGSFVYVRRLNSRLQERNKEIIRQQAVLEEQTYEISLTNEALNENNRSLEEARSQADSLLLNILPASIARRLKAGETRIAERFDSVSVMFIDVSGFTSLAGRTEPEVLVAILDEMFSRFDELAEHFKLEKIKTIGDAYMVVGGLPERSDDHVWRVAAMAVAVLETVSRLGVEFQLHDLNVRCGMHAGAVVAGVIGKKKIAYDLWGDTVNIASRMESHGEVGKIHVSEEVFRLLRNVEAASNQELPCFEFEERGQINIKGKGTMKTYFLRG
jgi:class 3 adenylate cyclase/cytochrome c-type biogenesis protein CcmH/NrfG